MKILASTFYVFSIVLLLSIAGLFLASMLPIPGNIEIKIVKSGSMEPTIPTGSLVVIKPVEAYKLRDIVTFGADTPTQIPTTHRIVASRVDNGTWYTTKGDANEEQDTKEINQSEIIGKVVAHVPNAGYVLDFAKKPLGFLLLIGIPAATIIIDELINIFREVYAFSRRRDRGDGHGGGGSYGGTADSHVIFARRFSMDDIFVPLRVLKTRAAQRLVSERQYINASTSAFAIIAMVALSTGGTAGTLSYFRDTEQSTQNMFGAGAWATSTPPMLIDAPEMTARFFSITEEEGEVLGEDTTLDEPAPEVTDQVPQDKEAAPADVPSDIPAEEPAVMPPQTEERAPVDETQNDTQDIPPPESPPVDTPADIVPPPAEEPPAPPPAEDPPTQLP